MKKYSFKKEKKKVLKKVDSIFGKMNSGDVFNETYNNEIQMKKEVIKHILDGM